MKIEIEDVVFTILGLIILALFFAFLLKYESPIPSLAVIWIGATLLLVGYTYVYVRKKRDMRILKMNMVVIVIPFYIILTYLSYHDLIGYDRSPSESSLISLIALILLGIRIVGKVILKIKK
jgi:hypothetical protein